MQPKYVPVEIKSDLSPADLYFNDSHRDSFPEMEVIQRQTRRYPQNGLLSHAGPRRAEGLLRQEGARRTVSAPGRHMLRW
ncbi:MAG: hypothetical protein P4L56_13960 [Candidatus Sulfopaludibacter sp.]|nr:hypothetical protein [Candidatus Sulfopaludibacter sp.]